ncbi:MAG: glutamine-hydrolyzing GMP synthase [Candidatus Bathyarchaeia archaeon]
MGTSERIKPRTNAILILDFGGQYCHLIGRRVRELGVYSEILPCEVKADEINSLQRRFEVKGIVLSGGPSSVYDEKAPRCDPRILSLGIPVLGICYGHQLIAQLYGGDVEPGIKKEYGVTYAIIERPVGVLKGLGPLEKVWMSHGDTVYGLPEGFEILARTENCPIAAFRHTEKPIYGLQWHPEVIHTEKGLDMLRNFLFEVCRCEANWTMEDFIDRAVKEIRENVGGRRCIIALSGGVDSSTAAVLAARAIGSNLTAVFVDHGFMRDGESEFVKKTFEALGLRLIVLDERRRFMERLRGVKDPEEKRKIIGEEFIRVFEDVARREGAEYLVQGTIYPDRIESGFRRHSEKIKTHHNVAGLPTKMEFRGILEPLRDLYKDEVRRVAEALGLPERIVWRQPFPGPGLAVRVMGELTPEKVEIVRKAERIVEEEFENSGMSKSLWQYFAILTDTKSTGIKGDSRAYGYCIAVRAVESREAMTASYAKIPYEILERISTRITNEIPEVTRVVYDITHKPPATIEWE